MIHFERVYERSRGETISCAYAATPVLPGEDESAYREMEKMYLEYYAPVGPDQVMLVRELTGAAWNLSRIDRAKNALHKRLRDEPIVRFLRSLNDDEMVYVKSKYSNDLYDQLSQYRDQIEDEIRGEPDVGSSTEYIEPEELGEMPSEEVKDYIDARLVRILEFDNIILAGLVPKSEAAPQERLDRARRAFVKYFFSCEAKLRELQQARLTVNSAPVPVASKEVIAMTSKRYENSLPTDRQAHHNLPELVKIETEESAISARTNRPTQKHHDNPLIAPIIE